MDFMKLIITIIATIILVIYPAQSALQVPFQDFATPTPEISSKIYYLTDSCDVCQKFRPDFTLVKKPEEPPKPEPVAETNSTEKELKRVERDVDGGSSSEKPEIVLLDYKINSGNDNDTSDDGQQFWQKAFKQIKAKWLEKFGNNTGRKVDNKITAKLEKTVDEGEEKSKMTFEWKKKIENITVLDNDVLRRNLNKNDDNDKPKEKVLVKRELKQIVLDPVKQPSIRIRSRRSIPENETATEQPVVIEGSSEETTTTITVTELPPVERKDNSTYEKCRLLIRFKTNDTVVATTNETAVPEPEIIETVTTGKPQLVVEEEKLETTTMAAAVPMKKDDETEKLISKENVKAEETPKIDEEKKKEESKEKMEPKSESKIEEKKETETSTPSTEKKIIKEDEKENKIAPKDVEEKKEEVPEVLASGETKPKELKKEEKDSKIETKHLEEKKIESPPEDKKEEKSTKEAAVQVPDESKKMDEPKKTEDSKKEPEKIEEKKPEPEPEKPKVPEASTLKPETSSAPKPEKVEEKLSTPEMVASSTTAVTPAEPKTTAAEPEKAKEKTKPENPIVKSIDAQLGLMVNIRKFVGSMFSDIGAELESPAFEKKKKEKRNVTDEKEEEKKKRQPFWKNFKIYSSDPDLTEFWYEGTKVENLKSKDKDDTIRMKRSTDYIEEEEADNTNWLEDMQDIVQLLQNESIDLNVVNEKWILIERKVFFDDPSDPDQDEEELIINLFFKPKPMPIQEVRNHHLKTSIGLPGKLRCPIGTFDCHGNGTFCIPDILKCNGEDNCGNGRDEMLATANCAGNPGSVNLYYVYNHGPTEDGIDNGIFDSQTETLWFGGRILFILFATSLFLYILLLLCRMCDRIRRSDSPAAMLIVPKGNYISISGDTIERKPVPLSPRYHPQQYGGSKGSKMDNNGSHIREYIYVNNNYGQPQGSTVVSTDVQPDVSINGKRSKYPPGGGKSGRKSNGKHQQLESSTSEISDDEYPPLYEDYVRQYGTKK